MSWKEDILEGMKLIRKGCFENDGCIDCLTECPLAELCAHTRVIYHPVCWDLLDPKCGEEKEKET